MRIHTKVRYGLRTMVEIARQQSEEGILQKDIAEKQGIPIKYLDIIVAGLKSAGLIVNYSGKSSGYVLSTSPKQISVYDVYRAFEPELTLVNCQCPGNVCERLDICPTTDYWTKLNYEIKNLMSNARISDLVN